MNTHKLPETEIHPAMAERWADLESIFGPGGAYANCWCMFWRLKRKDFKDLKGGGRKAILREMTLTNKVPGLLAYVDGQPVGWCSIGPREEYAALENSRSLKRIDNVPVWSIVCFFVIKEFRKKGIMLELLRGAVEYARQHGAKAVEGYPIDLQSSKLVGKKLSGCSGYMGIVSTFRAAGFVEVECASETQRIMRFTIENKA
jgi:GNAT superfamily N-acetyltransferase